MDKKRKTEKYSNLDMSSENKKECLLVLHNDDIHDFNYVIETLVKICGHNKVQAEQCAYIVHYKGECDIRRGSYLFLKSMYNQLCEKGLIVTLNEQVCR